MRVISSPSKWNRFLSWNLVSAFLCRLTNNNNNLLRSTFVIQQQLIIMKKRRKKTTNKILLFYCLKNRKELVVSVSFDKQIVLEIWKLQRSTFYSVSNGSFRLITFNLFSFLFFFSFFSRMTFHWLESLTRTDREIQ